MANYVFYEELSESCCQDLYRYDLPLFTPSTPDTRAGKIDVTSAGNKLDKSHMDRKEAVRLENLMSNMSLGLSLGEVYQEVILLYLVLFAV